MTSKKCKPFVDDAFTTAIVAMLQQRIASGEWRVVAVGTVKTWPTVLEEAQSMTDPVIILIDASKKPTLPGAGV